MKKLLFLLLNLGLISQLTATDVQDDSSEKPATPINPNKHKNAREEFLTRLARGAIAGDRTVPKVAEGIYCSSQREHIQAIDLPNGFMLSFCSGQIPAYRPHGLGGQLKIDKKIAILQILIDELENQEKQQQETKHNKAQ